MTRWLCLLMAAAHLASGQEDGTRPRHVRADLAECLGHTGTCVVFSAQGESQGGGGATTPKPPLWKRALIGPEQVNWSEYGLTTGIFALSQYLDYASTRDFDRAGYCEANRLFRKPGEPCRPDLRRVLVGKLIYFGAAHAGKYVVVRLSPKMARPANIVSVALAVKSIRTARVNWDGVGAIAGR